MCNNSLTRLEIYTSVEREEKVEKKLQTMKVLKKKCYKGRNEHTIAERMPRNIADIKRYHIQNLYTFLVFFFYAVVLSQFQHEDCQTILHRTVELLHEF